MQQINTPTVGPEVTLEARTDGGWHTYVVTFEGPDAEARAIAYVEARGATHTFDPADGQGVSDELLRALYPYAFETCPHGLSSWLCADPINHYPADR